MGSCSSTKSESGYKTNSLSNQNDGGGNIQVAKSSYQIKSAKTMGGGEPISEHFNYPKGKALLFNRVEE